MAKKITLLLALVLVLLFHSSSYATSFYVASSGNDVGSCSLPEYPCRTIQYAISEVNDGGVIKVAHGTYYENIVIRYSFYVDSFTLQGGWNEDFSVINDDPAVTIIDGRKIGHVIEISPGYHDRSVTIENFTIRHGDTDTGGGGVHAGSSLDNQSLSLINNIIVSNNGNRGGGVNVSIKEGGSFDILLDRNQILSNSAVTGGGIYLAAFSDSTITISMSNNIIASNNVSGSGGEDGVVIIAWGSNSIGEDGINSVTEAVLTNNTFADDGIKLSTERRNDSLNALIVNTIIDGTLETDKFSDSEVNVNVSHSIVKRTYGSPRPVIRDPVYSYPNPIFQDKEAGDFHLAPDSGAIDAGICGRTNISTDGTQSFEWIAPQTDFEGDLRPETDNNWCDIGADEQVVTMPSPVTFEHHRYQPTEKPMLGESVEQSTPWSQGDLEDETVDFEVKLPEFEAPVDVYLGLSYLEFNDVSDGLGTVYLIDLDNRFQPLNTLEPWRSNTTGNIQELLFGSIPLSALPEGYYWLMVLVTPTGILIPEQAYFWETMLEVPDM